MLILNKMLCMEKKKKKRERPHSSSPQARTQQEKPSPNHAGTLISDFQSPEL